MWYSFVSHWICVVAHRTARRNETNVTVLASGTYLCQIYRTTNFSMQNNATRTVCLPLNTARFCRTCCRLRRKRYLHLLYKRLARIILMVNWCAVDKLHQYWNNRYKRIWKKTVWQQGQEMCYTHCWVWVSFLFCGNGKKHDNRQCICIALVLAEICLEESRKSKRFHVPL